LAKNPFSCSIFVGNLFHFGENGFLSGVSAAPQRRDFLSLRGIADKGFEAFGAGRLLLGADDPPTRGVLIIGRLGGKPCPRLFVGAENFFLGGIQFAFFVFKRVLIRQFLIASVKGGETVFVHSSGLLQFGGAFDVDRAPNAFAFAR